MRNTSLNYFCVAVLVWTGGLMLFNYSVDPIQFYRKAAQPVFVLNQRYQIPGLIRNYEFDTAFIGTSHSENFIPSSLDRELGTKSLNLAISGSSAAEQKNVVELAVKSGKLKQVIWEMNYRSFSGINPNLVEGGEFPTYLYQVNPLSHIQYLFSIGSLWMSVKNLLGKGPVELDKLNYWGDKEKNKFDGKHVLEHFCRIKSNGDRAPLPLNFDVSIEENLGKIINANPQVAFHLFFPPFSFYNFFLGNEKEAVNLFRIKIYQLARLHQNVFLHDFMARYDVIGNKKYYKDIEHFAPAISEVIVRDIAKGFYVRTEVSDGLELAEEFNRFIEHQAEKLPDCRKLTPEQNSIKQSSIKL